VPIRVFASSEVKASSFAIPKSPIRTKRLRKDENEEEEEVGAETEADDEDDDEAVEEDEDSADFSS
jgi:hypothetical protein